MSVTVLRLSEPAEEREFGAESSQRAATWTHILTWPRTSSSTFWWDNREAMPAHRFVYILYKVSKVLFKLVEFSSCPHLLVLSTESTLIYSESKHFTQTMIISKIWISQKFDDNISKKSWPSFKGNSAFAKQTSPFESLVFCLAAFIPMSFHESIHLLAVS